MIFTHLALFSFFGGAGGAALPVVVTTQPDTHDGFGGYVHRAPARDEKAHRLDREEVRRRLESAFAQAEAALAPVSEIVSAKAANVEAETPMQLADIGEALEALAAIDRLGVKLAKAQERQMRETRKRLSEAEEEMALLMTIARLPWP